MVKSGQNTAITYNANAQNGIKGEGSPYSTEKAVRMNRKKIH